MLIERRWNVIGFRNVRQLRGSTGAVDRGCWDVLRGWDASRESNGLRSETGHSARALVEILNGLTSDSPVNMYPGGCSGVNG